MPLTDEQREVVEELIMDLHYTSHKVIDSNKAIHKQFFKVGIQEALDYLNEIKDNLKDDDSLYNYKMHMLIPLQLYNIIQKREEND